MKSREQQNQIDPDDYSPQGFMTPAERELEHCMVMAQGYLTTLALDLGRQREKELEREVRELIATSTVLREKLLDRVQVRLNTEAAARVA